MCSPRTHFECQIYRKQLVNLDIRSTTNSAAKFHVVEETNIGIVTQLATTFPFIVLYPEPALTQNDIVERQKDVGERKQIIEVLPKHEKECWKLEWIRKHINANNRQSKCFHGPIKLLFIAENIATASTLHLVRTSLPRLYDHH